MMVTYWALLCARLVSFNLHNNPVGLVLSLFPLNRQDTKRLIKLPEATEQSQNLTPSVLMESVLLPTHLSLSHPLQCEMCGYSGTFSSCRLLQASVRTRLKSSWAWSPTLGTRSSLPSTCCLLCGLLIGSPDFPEIGFDGGRSGWLRSIFLPNLRTNWETDPLIRQMETKMPA